MLDVIAPLLVLVLSVAIVSRLTGRYTQAEQPFLWSSYVAHLISCVLMILVVGTVYGGGDMFGYHAVGRFLANQARADSDVAIQLIGVLFQSQEPLPFPGAAVGSNTGSMQAFSAFMCLLFGDSLLAICFAMALGSFLAKLAFYNAFKRFLPQTPQVPLLYACLLVPSAVFWSSALLKEPVAVMGLGMMVSGSRRFLSNERSLSAWLILGLGVVTVGLFKGYIIPPFGVGAGLFFVATAVARRGTATVLRPRYLLIAALVASASIVLTGAALPHYAASTFEQEALSAQAVGARTSGGSNYSLAAGSLITQVPLALLTALFRPLPFDISSPMVAINALETTAFTAFAVRALFRRSLMDTIASIARMPALAFCVGFVMTLAVGVGLTTTNFGTLSRYRVPLVPFYCVLLAALGARQARGVVLGGQRQTFGTLPASDRPRIA